MLWAPPQAGFANCSGVPLIVKLNEPVNHGAAPAVEIVPVPKPAASETSLAGRPDTARTSKTANGGAVRSLMYSSSAAPFERLARKNPFSKARVSPTKSDVPWKHVGGGELHVIGAPVFAVSVAGNACTVRRWK